MNNQTEVLSLLREGLKASSSERSYSTLGDRTEYLGMSDLAQGLFCPRAVVAGKLSHDESELSLNKLITLERGHWLERGVEDALVSHGQKFISQLAINVIPDGVPIKAHLDLVLLDQVSHEVTVLELKSVGTIKESVAQTHEAQINGQISLLSKFWRDPVFQVNYNDKLVAFPEIVKQLLNVSLDDNPDKHSISGYVLTVSPNKAKAFGPYTPDINFLKELSGQAYFIWKTISDIRDGVKTLADVPIMDSFSPLCDYCRFNKECPKFKGESQLGLEQELAALAELKAQRNRLEEDINEREGQLKTLYTLMGKTGQWIDSGAYRFKVSTQKGRVTLDQFALKKNLIERLQLDEKLMTDIISFSSKTGKAFERFYLSPIN